MNAISTPDLPASPDDEHRAQRLRQCARLIDLGMEMAELAADRAREELQTKPHTDADPNAAAPRGPDGVTLFTRLSRCVQSVMAFEERLINRTQPCAQHPAEPKPFDHGIKDQQGFIYTSILNEALFRTSRSDPNRWNISQKTPRVVDDLVATLPRPPFIALFEQATEILGFEPDLTCLTPHHKEYLYPAPTG